MIDDVIGDDTDMSCLTQEEVTQIAVETSIEFDETGDRADPERYRTERLKKISDRVIAYAQEKKAISERLKAFQAEYKKSDHQQ